MDQAVAEEIALGHVPLEVAANPDDELAKRGVGVVGHGARRTAVV